MLAIAFPPYISFAMSNINDTILLVGAIQGFLLVMALFTKKTKNKLSNISVGLVVFVIALTILFSWGGATGYNNSKHVIPYWLLLSYLLIPAALWLFFEANTNPEFRVQWRHGLVFLPAMLEILVQGCTYFFPQILSREWMFRFLHSSAWFFVSEILPLFSTAIILFIYSRGLWRISRKYLEFNSRAYGTYFRNMFFMLLLMGVLFLIWTASAFYLVQYRFIEVALVLYIFALGYIAYFKPDFFEIPKLVTRSSGQFLNFDDKVELSRLNALFTDKFAYRKPKLTVKEVGDELKVPVKYISYLLSQYHAKNFNDFVNGFRVQEVIARMADPDQKNKSLLGIALDAGFNSKSSFNQVFKQHTGKTPSEYLFF